MKLRRTISAFAAAALLAMPVNAFTAIADETESSTCKVTFISNDVTLPQTEKEVEVGKPYGELPVPEKENYVLGGWTKVDIGKVVLNVYDAYGMNIVRFSTAEGYAGWDRKNSTKFNMGDIISFDVTFNDTVPIGLDINDKNVSESKYTIDGSRIYGQIVIDDDVYDSLFTFLDIHCEKLSEDFTVNEFCVIPGSPTYITAESIVETSADHALKALWNLDISGMWIGEEESDDGTTETYIYNFRPDGILNATTLDADGKAVETRQRAWTVSGNTLSITDFTLSNTNDNTMTLTLDGDKLTIYKESSNNSYYMTRFEANLPGDPTGDKKVDSMDASFCLGEYSNVATGGESNLPLKVRIAADVNVDGKVDSKDASTMLAYYSYTSTGGKDSLDEFLSPKIDK